MVSRPKAPVLLHQYWSAFRSAALNPSSDHWVLSGSSLTPLLPPSVAVLAEGSLKNKVFPQKREFPFFKRASSSGADKTASHPCPNRRSRRWALSCGLPTWPTSPITSPDPPFNNWSNFSLVRCSTVKISTPLLFESSVRAYTIRPLTKPSLIRRSSLPFPAHPNTSRPLWLTTSIKNMVDPTRGPSGKVANFHPATF